MVLTVADRPVRPLTADEVIRMEQLGILSEDEPVELLHGVLTVVSAKTPAHEAVDAAQPLALEWSGRRRLRGAASRDAWRSRTARRCPSPASWLCPRTVIHGVTPPLRCW